MSGIGETRRPLATSFTASAPTPSDTSRSANSRTIVVSDDGYNWLAVESGTQASLRAVAWGNGLWVAVGDFGEILTSPDGTNWTPRPNGLFFDLMGITSGGGLFVAVG